MKTYAIRTKDALAEAALDVLSMVQMRAKTGGSVVVGLSGDLGTGKTTFIQTLARQMGIRETVASPTFTIMKRYHVASPPFRSLVHVDAYRIESAEELLVLGFSELLCEDGVLICIEWPERTFGLMPKDAVMLTFSLRGEDDRTLTMSYAEEN